ncbi:glucosaminidase domain-containing protein [Riemerella anatipestifer]|uniref:Peptidoglycan hydrolase n=1 Tax=Riemerella anatipestifer TaxID=34085 RepID=A0AAP3AMZ5_RIEAN|nr:glucosaminidase domain-containing protein [Riemerella anatipestifer]MBT0572378.1 glucosaminidase domain-containing protein [Riemerella anatipestifer]MCU7567501.1 glucosaminidase domain-containing protein [Riemerella anatipestifer]MCW0489573.1 glucosaminidase domain-containing protein [Riemerella anatipestifer]MCW0523098.1 glucosaminidase domain-containing protein [Riemerella anatipestifer]MDR7795977.1 glucosaminidase domain-containing protein [Riemerella anatipestifer]
MKKFLIASAVLVVSQFKAQTWATDDQYIQRFAGYAVEEMEKYKIPASITLAQGILETGGGQSRLAKEGNNHFGIKCKEDWTGKTMRHTDDAPNECFRVYNDPKESYEDHSKFLAYRKYYTNLFKLDPKDYRAWAHGLKKAGYATNPRYAYILIDKIEKYKLYEFDNISSKEVPFALVKLYPELNNDKEFMAKINPQKEVKKKESVTVHVPYQQTSYAEQQKTADQLRKEKLALLEGITVKSHPNGGLKYVVIPTDTDVAYIAKKFDMREGRLLKWNDLSENKLKANDVLFLEPKSSTGSIETYKAEKGDTMHKISQKFGIKLRKLYSKNRMEYGEQPKQGQIIYLQKKAPRR